jgi:hypothetical protein
MKTGLGPGGSMRGARRASLVALLAACLLTMGMAGSAAAYSKSELYDFWYETPPNGDTSKAVSLGATEVASIGGANNCANYIDVGGGSGAGYCTTTRVTHPYCECAQRYSWVYNYNKEWKQIWGEAYWG